MTKLREIRETFVKENYRVMTDIQMAEKLGCSVSSVQTIRYSLGLKRTHDEKLRLRMTADRHGAVFEAKLEAVREGVGRLSRVLHHVERFHRRSEMKFEDVYMLEWVRQHVAMSMQALVLHFDEKKCIM